MNTKGKGKSKRDKAESKAIIGIVLATIMLASVFAGISASAVADNNNNTANESVGDSSVVGSEVGTNGVGGTISVEMGPKSPTANIDNGTHTNESVFQLRFTPADENIIINNLTIKQIGSIPATDNLTQISVIVDDGAISGKYDLGESMVGFVNATTSPPLANSTNLTIELGSGSGLLVETLKDIIICINTTEFELGKTVQMQLTSFNATGEMSGLPAVQEWTTPAPITSNLLIGTGNLTVSSGVNDIVNETKVDAGKNESGIVIMQANFTAAIENCNLKNITLEWNGSANATKDIDTIYLVNDSDADGVLNFSKTGETIVTGKGNFSSSVKLEFLTGEPVEIGENRTFLVVVNTTKTFWSGETLAVNITDFNATGDTSGYIVSKKGTTLASNHTIGRAKIKVELGDNQPVYTRIPAADDHTNLEITQFNFTVTAGEVNITHIVLQANSTLMESADANNTWPRIWWDKNNDGYITHLINRSERDIPLNTSGDFNLSMELHTYGVNVNLTPGGNLTIGGNETTFGDVGYDSKQIIVAFNTTNNKPLTGNDTKIEINRTATGYNYTAFDTTVGAITDTSEYFDANKLRAETMTNANPLWVSFDNKPIEGGVKAGENEKIPVMQLNLTNMQSSDIDPTIYIRSITVTENGTANETMIKDVALCIDVDGDGKYDGEPLNASVNFEADSSSVILTPDSPIEIPPEYTSKYLLILVNTTSNFPLGNTLRFNISNPSLDIYATAYGTMFGITNHTTDEISGNELTAMGTISASLGANTPDDGTVSADANATYLPLMQLNFTAGAPEDVNVTSLTVTWNGTGVSGASATSSIGIVNDTNGNGEIDWDLGETVINATTFSTNTSVHDLSGMANVTKSNTSSILIYVNTTATSLSSGYKLAINISNPSTNYSAVGVTSTKEINDTITTAISSNVQTVKSSGEIWVDQLPLVKDTIIKNETNADVVLLRLNLTAKGEKVNVTSMKIKGIGGINETGNVTGVALKTDAEGVISDSKDFESENGYVELTITPALTIGKDASKEIDVIATILTGTLSAGNEIIIGLNNPATDLKAVGYLSGVPIQNTSTATLQNTTTVTGKISVDSGDNNTAAGPVTAMVQNRTAILQLNFSASHEAINITAINVSWVGTENATNGNITIVAYNDTNGTTNGTWDANDIYLGEGTFDVNNTANVSFDTNLTVPSGNSTNMLICLNVTSGYNFTIGEELKINVTNYVAVGNTSEKTITPVYGTPKVSNTLTGTGNITVVNGTNTPATQYILAGANTTVPVWQLNMSTNGENATLNNITLTFNGTATGISAVDLYYDENSSATVDGNDTHIASGTISNSKVTLTPTAFYINTTPVKSLLVTVNTTGGFKDNKTIAFNITCTKEVNATGVESGKVIARNISVVLSSNTLTGYCSIDVYNTTQQAMAYNGTHTNVEVLKLNFSAPRCNVDIANITLQENGTAKVDPATSYGVKNISVWYDSVCYNSTAQFTTENGSLVINTTGLTLDCLATNEVTIKVNTTVNLTTGQILFFEVNRTRGVGYNATCNASGETPYSNETGEINNTITVTAPTAVVEIGLDTNWNLISLWLIPANKSIDVVTTNITSNLDGVYYYDAYTGDWKSYFPSWGVGSSTLKEMDTGEGYWVNMTAADMLPVSGSFLPSGGVTPPSYSVYDGWNLMGFHSENETTNASTYFGTQGTDWQSIFKWNNQTDSYTSVTPSTTLNKGEGYWLAALKDYTVYPM